MSNSMSSYSQLRNTSFCFVSPHSAVVIIHLYSFILILEFFILFISFIIYSHLFIILFEIFISYWVVSNISLQDFLNWLKEVVIFIFLLSVRTLLGALYKKLSLYSLQALLGRLGSLLFLML